MDLVMRKLSTGEEKIVSYDFDFNIGSDGQANFEVTMPIDAEVWDMFYVDNYTRDNEYCGFVTETEIQTTENQKLVRGNTIRYYLWSSVIPEALTVPSNDLGSTIFGYVFSSYLFFPDDGLSHLLDYVTDGSVSGNVQINRFDSTWDAILKLCAFSGRVCIPRYGRDEDGDVGITFTVRAKNTYYPRIDDGEVGGTGEATLDTQLSRNVFVLAAGTGEGAARIIRYVWYDGSSFQTSEDIADVPLGYEEYFLDYTNADLQELVQKAKEIAYGYYVGSTDMSASGLEITPGATIGDIVNLSGKVEHTAQISGMILRRVSGVVTEEFTYSETEAETTSASVSTINTIFIDDALSSSSMNPVQNKVINSALTPVAVTGWSAGTNCSLGSHCHAWTIGKYCMVALNLQITGSISSGATLISGMPKNSASRVCFAAARSGGTQSAAMRITENSTAITADGAITTTGYYDAFFIYIMA